MLRRSYPFVLLVLLLFLLIAFTPLGADRSRQGPETPAPKAPVQQPPISAGRRVEVKVRGATFSGVLDQDLPLTAMGWIVVVQDARRVVLPIVNVDSVKEL
jgi:hypothetical protein